MVLLAIWRRLSNINADGFTIFFFYLQNEILCIKNIIVFSLVPWLRHYTSPDNTIGEQFPQKRQTQNDIPSAIRGGLQSYCSTTYSMGGLNQMWILKNSKDLLEYIQPRSLSSCSSIKHLTSLLSTQIFSTKLVSRRVKSYKRTRVLRVLHTAIHCPVPAEKSEDLKYQKYHLAVTRF